MVRKWTSSHLRSLPAGKTARMSPAGRTPLLIGQFILARVRLRAAIHNRLEALEEGLLCFLALILHRND